jgi:hypothetical protein
MLCLYDRYVVLRPEGEAMSQTARRAESDRYR